MSPYRTYEVLSESIFNVSDILKRLCTASEPLARRQVLEVQQPWFWTRYTSALGTEAQKFASFYTYILGMREAHARRPDRTWSPHEFRMVPEHPKRIPNARNTSKTLCILYPRTSHGFKAVQGA